MEEIKLQLEKAKKLLILKKSEGGKVIISELQSDIDDLVGRLAAMYADQSHIQLITELAKLSAKKNLLGDIIDSERQVELLKNELKQLEEEENNK